MRRLSRIALIVPVICLLVTGCSLFKSEEESEPKQVTYRVTYNNQPQVEVTYKNETGEQIDVTVDTPWEYEFTGDPGIELYLKGKKTSSDYVTLRVSILLDGEVYKENNCLSQYCSVSVSGSVP